MVSAQCRLDGPAACAGDVWNALRDPDSPHECAGGHPAACSQTDGVCLNAGWNDLQHALVMSGTPLETRTALMNALAAIPQQHDSSAPGMQPGLLPAAPRQPSWSPQGEATAPYSPCHNLPVAALSGKA